MAKHPTSIPGFESLEQLAETIGNLRYDALEEFLRHLEEKLAKDSLADMQRGREQLSGMLHSARYYIGYARLDIGRAWRLSKPYMDP